MSAREEVRDYLIKMLRETKDDRDPVGDADSLVISGRLSSLDVVDVLLFLETRFGLTMDPTEFDQSRFDTVDSIMAMLGDLGTTVK